MGMWEDLPLLLQPSALLPELRTPLPEECDFVSKRAKDCPGCLSLVWAMITCHVVVILL